MTKFTSSLVAIFGLVPVACGDDDGNGSEGEAESESEGEGCSEQCKGAIERAIAEKPTICDECASFCDPTVLCSLPDADVMANTGLDDEADPVLEAADYSCLGTNTPPPAPAEDVEVSGIVADYFTMGPVADATVDVFASADDTSMPLATVTADGAGAYTIIVPVATLTAARVAWRVTATDALSTLHANQAIECTTKTPCATTQDRLSVSVATSQALPGLLGSSFPKGSAIVVGDILDCQRRSVAYANGRLFQGETLAAGVEEYFFQQVFPVRRDVQQWTSPDGLFGLLKVQSAVELDVRAYGNIDGAETLLSSATFTPEANSVMIADMEPLAE